MLFGLGHREYNKFAKNTYFGFEENTSDFKFAEPFRHPDAVKTDHFYLRSGPRKF